MEGWQPLNLESLDDTSLANGRKLHYGFPKKRDPRGPEDFNQIRLDKKDLSPACGKHTDTVVALISEKMGIPVELLEVTSMKTIQSGTGSKLGIILGCMICEDNAWHEREEEKRLKS